MKLFGLQYYLGVSLANLSPFHRMIVLGKGRAFCDKVCGEKPMATDACCDSPSRGLLLPRHELHVHSDDLPDEKRTPFAAGYAGEVPMGPSKKRPISPIGPKPGIARKQMKEIRRIISHKKSHRQLLAMAFEKLCKQELVLLLGYFTKFTREQDFRVSGKLHRINSFS